MGRKKLTIKDKCLNSWAKALDDSVHILKIDAMYDKGKRVLETYAYSIAQHNTQEEQSKAYRYFKEVFIDFFDMLEEPNIIAVKKQILSALINMLALYNEWLKEKKDERSKRIEQVAKGFIFGTEYTLKGIYPSLEIINKAEEICLKENIPIPKRLAKAIERREQNAKK